MARRESIRLRCTCIWTRIRDTTVITRIEDPTCPNAKVHAALEARRARAQAPEPDQQ